MTGQERCIYCRRPVEPVEMVWTPLLVDREGNDVGEAGPPTMTARKAHRECLRKVLERIGLTERLAWLLD